MKKLIVAGLVGLCIGMVYLFPHSMLEPGELVEAHQRTGSDCFSCHTPFKGLTSAKCIACHSVADIGKDTLLAKQPALFHEALGAMECVACHTDHQGRVADVTPGGFQHDMLAMSITEDCYRCHAKPEDDLHGGLPNKCNACHVTAGWKPARAFDHDLLAVDRRGDCASCHSNPMDVMHERVKNDCANCHSVQGWSPATFEHANLTADQRNACMGCHVPPGEAFHQNRKDNCASCHSVKAWVPSTFDHTRYFRLDGDHNAKCATCHKTKDYSTYSCYGCHEHTPGKIMSEHREEGITNINDCVRCHRSGDEDDIRMDGRSGPMGKEGARPRQSREGRDD
ncbi:MAG TPA: cytochrome c3 family protein [Flavobacteriales bacterium]|nr:cytochrome c3 family protein [Flavobacteriales bacterium]